MIVDANKTNAQRFIAAYNVIDQQLRSIYNFKRNMTFSDMIRRTVPLNSVVRKYEDKLIDFARLRNSIIHNSNEEYAIAEPHDDVVLLMEKIAQIVSCPPKVVDAVAKKNVLTLTGNVSLKNVTVLMASTGFKSFPVYENDAIIGVATPNRIIEWVGSRLDQGRTIDDLFEKTHISETLRESDANVRFCICDEGLTIQQALDKFYNNRLLSAIIITANGTVRNKILGMVTVADLMDLGKILDDYE